jgi:prepilin peptidase CpaA
MDYQPTLTLLAFAALLIAAVECDLRTRRIPNALIGVGISLGLFFQAIAPAGSGLFAIHGAALGLGPAVMGGVVGLSLFLPMYALRAMGAGDIKLLAMVGVWLGASGVAWAALWTLLAGGAMALTVALVTGVLRQVMFNVRILFAAWARRGHPAHEAHAAPLTGRLPYAVAIAFGTTAELFRQLSHAA